MVPHESGRSMPKERSRLGILVYTAFQLLLLGVGVGLVFIGRATGIDALFWIGLAISAVMIVWIFISCFLHGINPFDV